MTGSRGAHRGRTRAGRLAALDAWLIESELLAVDSPRVVDLGLGDRPDTTIELFRVLRSGYPTATVCGVDHEPSRVETAAAQACDGLSFAVGGFRLTELGPPAHLIRALNVLRGYSLHEAQDAHRTMAHALVDGGWLLEGTSSPDGHVAVVHLLQRDGAWLHRRGLWCFTDGRRGFSPIMIRDRVPRDLRRVARHAHPLEAFFDAWLAAWESVRRTAADPFEASVRALASIGFDWEPPGVAVWRPARGVPCHDGQWGPTRLSP